VAPPHKPRGGAPPPRSIRPPRRNGEPEPKENNAIAERIKLSPSPTSQPAQDQDTAGAVTPNPPDAHQAFRRHARKLAQEAAERPVLFVCANPAYIASSRDIAEFLTRAGQDAARVLAAASDARRRSDFPRALRRLRRASWRIGQRRYLGRGRA
jgi:hypothetical protein